MVLNALLDIFRGGKTPRDGTAPSKKRPRKSEKCAETSKLSKLSRLSSFTECPDASVNLAFTTLVGRTLCDDDARKMALLAAHLSATNTILTPDVHIEIGGWECAAAAAADVAVGRWVEKAMRDDVIEAMIRSDDRAASSAAKLVLKRTFLGRDAEIVRRAKILAASLPPGDVIRPGTTLNMAGWKSPNAPATLVAVGKWWCSTLKELKQGDIDYDAESDGDTTSSDSTSPDDDTTSSDS